MRRYKILIIDDEVKLLHRLERMLTAQGYQIVLAENGQRGLDILKKQSFHIVITDMIMPDISGSVVMDYVRKHSPETLMLVITGHASLESSITALRKGAYDYIVKPFRGEVIKKSINQAIDKIEAQQRLLEATRQLQFMALTDGLTNVYNQHYFQERLAEEFERTKRYRQPLSCVMIDVDYFKKLNDTYGHLEGDKILKGVAQTIKQSVRTSDLIARYGGDEFVLLLPQTPSDKAYMLAERIQKAVTSNFSSDYKEVGPLTISLGLSTLPHPNIKGHNELVASADRALYKAKQAGRNCIGTLTD